MNALAILATEETTTGGGFGVIIIWIVVLVLLMYLMIYRPQQREKKKKNSMLSDLAVGDTILTTSGFYGELIDINEDGETVIVEFGSNRNCRIPMQKSAIAEVEKPEDAIE